MKLEFRLLGDIAVLADGRQLDLGGTRQRSVLALLLLNRNQPISTELLAERLWPDDQPLSAVKTIQVYVSRLRHALGANSDRLASTRTGYRLAVAEHELDAAQFERGLRQAREILASGSADAARARLEEILGLWSGSALGDLAGEQFARREADRLEELRLQTIEELFELRIAAGSGRETISELRRILADQPGRERLWRLLMLALYVDGRQAEALHAYQEARRYLVEQLGIDPGPELSELERAILTQEAPRPKQASRMPAAHSDDAVAANVVAAGIEMGTIARRRRVVTVLRADGVPASDGAQLDPEVLDLRQRRALDVIRRAVERHGGIIDHADHDGVTAVFGLTAAREDDGLRAVRAAVELRGDTSSAGYRDAPHFRIGVATGEVLAEARENHSSTLVGAPFQVAANLSASAGPDDVLLAPETERLVRWTAATEAVAVDAKEVPPGEPAVRLVAFADGEPITRRTDTHFVAREAELEALLGAYERVETDATPSLVTVIGAPGVGKSRLVAEAFGRIGERARVLRSRCLPYGDGITYWPIRDLVLAAAGIVTGDPRDVALAKLEAVVGGRHEQDVICSRVASVVGLSEEQASGEQIRWAVRRIVEILAAERPLVLLIDDLQWAEPALLDLLEHLLDLGRGAILLVTVARPEFEEMRPDWLARSRLLVRLDPLAETDAASLLDHLAPELAAGPLRSMILATAEGSPLFVEQLAGYVSDETPGGRSLRNRTNMELPIPSTIDALLAARLDRLPEIERRALERASVVGRVFVERALAELLPDDDRPVLPRTLAQLARRDLIRPDRSNSDGDDAYRFRHLLIRDAAYGALPKRDRAELHERHADWLADRPGGNPGGHDLIVGYHLEQAFHYLAELGDPRPLLAERALQLLAPAGQAALERGDAHAAAALVSRALRLSPHWRQRAELLLHLRTAQWSGGLVAASDAADAEFMALLAEHPDEGLAHQRRLNEIFITGITIALANDAYAYYERVGDAAGALRALQAMVMINTNMGQFMVGLDLLDRATALAAEIGGRNLAGRVSAEMAAILTDCPVPLPEALDRLRGYLDLAGDNREARAVILLVIGELEARSGVRETWRRHFDAAKAIIDDLDLVFQRVANYPSRLGDAELAAGEAGRSLELLRESCTTLERLGHRGFLAMIAPLTAQTLLEIEQLDEVERYAIWGRDVADSEDIDAQRRWRLALSGLRSRQGRAEEAIALAREAVALVNATEWTFSLGLAHLALAEALRSAGDESAARTEVLEAQRLASTTQDQSTLRKVAAFLAA